uniref:Transmembrane protein 209 n=1 Tax=Trichuris muris TaxID=70415 RepID=A0A5S6QRW8_TRIMR
MPFTSKIVQMNKFTREVMKCRSEYLRFQRSSIGLYANVCAGALAFVDVWLLQCRLSAWLLSRFVRPEIAFCFVVAVLVVCSLNLITATVQYGRILWASYDVSLSPKQKVMLGIERHDESLFRTCTSFSYPTEENSFSKSTSGSLLFPSGKNGSSKKASTASPDLSSEQHEEKGKRLQSRRRFVNRKFYSSVAPNSTTILARAAFNRALATLRKAQSNPVTTDGGRFIRSRDQIRAEWARRSQGLDVSHKSHSLLSTASSSSDMSHLMSQSPSGASWKSSDSWLFVEAQKSREQLSPASIGREVSPFMNGKRNMSKDLSLNNYVAKPAMAKSSTPKTEPCSLNTTLKKFSLSEERLALYAENLRLWISVTILKPLVGEVDRINEVFAELSRPDVKVGESPVTTLQSILTARSEQLSTLASVIRYLEISTNQEYLVGRIRCLAKDSAIAEYKWNAGGSFGQKSWDEHLPTDTEILFHLFCTFLDNQLPVSPLCLDGRTFSAEHVAKAPNVPCPCASTLCIYQTSVNPPHFQLIQGIEWHDMGKGKNNFFYTIILFLQALKVQRGAFLDQVNLGPSGLNLLWIFQ